MKASEHFKITHEFHKAVSNEHKLLASACQSEDYEKMTEHQGNIAMLHADYAAHCDSACADATRKAADAELEKVRSSALEPPAISRVTPTPPGVTAVPRAGGKPMTKLRVDEEFASLVKSADDRADE